MAKNLVSDNVGGVKQLLSTLRRALEQKRHFALVEVVALLYQPRLARNQYSGQELGPTHAISSSATAIMITTSNSSVKRSGMPNQLLGVRLHTMAISWLSACEPNLVNRP
jgi:hypothetical protein